MPVHHERPTKATMQPLSTLPVLYISGPMSGKDDFNFPAFNELARRLRLFGFPVLNPADFGADASLTWAECLKRDLVLVGHCDVLILLPGYADSAGATLEVSTALGLKKRIVLPDNLGEFVSEYISLDWIVRIWELDKTRNAMTIHTCGGRPCAPFAVHTIAGNEDGEKARVVRNNLSFNCGMLLVDRGVGVTDEAISASYAQLALSV